MLAISRLGTKQITQANVWVVLFFQNPDRSKVHFLRDLDPKKNIFCDFLVKPLKKPKTFRAQFSWKDIFGALINTIAVARDVVSPDGSVHRNVW